MPKTKTMDVYERERLYLLKYPHLIYSHWMEQSPLFQLACHPDLKSTPEFGCLTMIASDAAWVAQTPELTMRIKADRRIPHEWSSIKSRGLKMFVEWQRDIDIELGRTPPERHPGEPADAA